MLFSRQAKAGAYITTFFDAIVLLYAIKLASAALALGMLPIFVYGISRVCGLALANYLDRRLALGLIEVTIYKHSDAGISLADTLRAMGYSVTTHKGFGINGKERMVLVIITRRRELPKLIDVVGGQGKTHLAVKEVINVSGKVGKMIRFTGQSEGVSGEA